MPFKRIYTLTPNPALDLNGVVTRLVENEKNYVFEEKRYAGGNAINAAQVIASLDCPVTASGFIGGAVGEQVKKLIAQANIKTDFVNVSEETRVNITVSNQETHKQTRLSFMGPHLSLNEKQKLFKKITKLQSGTLLILGGSFPPNFLLRDAKTILKMAHKKKIPCIVDVPSKDLKKILSSRPLMIKPNLFEFQELVGKQLSSIPQIIKAAQKLLKKSPIICISSVNKGSLLITSDKVLFASGPRVPVKSTVGAGDSMVGAIAAGLVSHNFEYDYFYNSKAKKTNDRVKDWEEILKTGMGAALATITLPGTALGQKREILKYSKKIKIKAI